MAKKIVERGYKVYLLEFPNTMYDNVQALEDSGILETATPPFCIGRCEVLITEEV